MQDLGDRTSKYSVRLIKFLKNLKPDLISDSMIRQVIRSGTAIGANYQEACGAESKNDFQHKARIAKKEAKETLYWLGLLSEGLNIKNDDLSWLVQETDEFVKILGKMGSP